MKQRFSSLDVQIIAHELSNSLTSLRLANVYDLSTRHFLLKFAKPNQREQLLIDSGFRCHLTQYSRTTAAAPSPFVARLRKFLRTRRCTAVRQIGTDRVIELQFSDGSYRLFLEFYAGGNVVLCDADLTIIGLLRSVNEGAEHEQYRLGLKYSLSLRQNSAGVPTLTRDWLKDALQVTVHKQQEQAQKPGKMIKKKAGDPLRKALAVTTTQFPPVLLDHALHVSGVDRELQPERVLESDALLDQVLQALKTAERVVEEITAAPVAKGYILAKRKQSAKDISTENEVADTSQVMYEDFHPFKPAQLAVDDAYIFLEHDGFNLAVDEFFSSIEGQKLESRLQEREENAKKRIDHARKEQEQRIGGLQQVQELNVRKAQAIEANVERVEEAVAAVNGLIAQGMDWVDIGRLVENEQARNNPVAEMIKLPLKLHENTITLLLSELDQVEDEEMDDTDSELSDSEDEGAQATPARTEEKRLATDIDLAASAWSNARQYYDQKRTAAEKQERTVAASKKALKSTEEKVMAGLKKDLKQEKDVLRPVRKQFWFEKFIYFISSDGYLVLAGKDAQQNEMLYRRYLKKGDVYIHADLHGAASVIIKNNPSTPGAPIPPSTLSQAGDLAVCTSNAWDSKAVMSAWWVNADQVSKTAPTGEYLATGGFMVRGKKNFLPPARLLLGFGVMFQISEESKARHVKHRLIRHESFMATPDLTDAETAAESSVAEEENDESDDDFPDVAAPAPKIEDDDDDFPNAAPSQLQGEISSDESPEEQRERTYGSHDYSDEDEDQPYRSANPLQSAGVSKSTEDHLDDKGEDEGDDEHDSNADVHTENGDGSELDREDTESTVTSADAAPTEASQENEVEQPAESQPLSNKERKALARLAKDRKPQPSLKSAAKQVRGKRGKAKKAAAKYADQDEEDREIAMKLLGSRKAEEQREAEAAAQEAKCETAEEARIRRRAQHEKAQREGLEAEEIRRLNLEEGIDDLDEEELAALTQLDTLIGQPLAGDEILEAIPICAPWAALARYKYKAKLQPGQQKKGKAVREILGKWGRDASDGRKVDATSKDIEKIWPREAELIRGWREPEVIGILPVKSVRVMTSGAASGAGGEKGGRGRGGGRGGRGSKRR